MFLTVISGNCYVDFEDFAIMAETWQLEQGQIGYNSDCDISEPYMKNALSLVDSGFPVKDTDHAALTLVINPFLHFGTGIFLGISQFRCHGF